MLVPRQSLTSFSNNHPEAFSRIDKFNPIEFRPRHSLLTIIQTGCENFKSAELDRQIMPQLLFRFREKTGRDRLSD